MDIGLTVGDSIGRTEMTIEGFDFAEFSIGEGTDSTDIDGKRLERVLTASEAELCVHLPFQQVVVTPVPEINEAILAYQSRLLEWAGGYGANKAVLHGTARNPHDVDLRDVFADQLAAIGHAAAEADVELVVENVGHQKRGLPLSVLGDLARETDTAVCFDVGHAYMEDGMDGIDRFLSGYDDLISHLHVHDARSRGDTHLPLGAGEIDYCTVAAELPDFDGTAAVEVFTDDVALLRDTRDRIERHLTV